MNAIISQNGPWFQLDLDTMPVHEACDIDKLYDLNELYDIDELYNFDEIDEINLQLIPEIAEFVQPVAQPEQKHWWSELEHQHIPDKPGIYAIINTLNGHFYIGSAMNLYRRKDQHFRDLYKKDHHCPHLQNAYSIYGSKAFLFVIVERIEHVENLLEREQYYIDKLKPDYNIARVAGSQLGAKRSIETRKKMSEARKGRAHSEETRKKMSLALRKRYGTESKVKEPKIKKPRVRKPKEPKAKEPRVKEPKQPKVVIENPCKKPLQCEICGTSEGTLTFSMRTGKVSCRICTPKKSKNIQ